MRRFLIAIALLAVTGCDQISTYFPPPEVPMRTAEYAVLSALLQTMFIGSPPPKMLVIEEATDSRYSTFKFNVKSPTQERGGLTDITDEIATDFAAANKKPQVFERQFNISVNYVFISKEDLTKIFKSDNGWSRFYEKYPDAPGKISLSRPGFNAAMDTALVYVGQQSDWLAGAGYFVIMKKIDNTWTLQEMEMIWIS